jgi:hypothetical protein
MVLPIYGSSKSEPTTDADATHHLSSADEIALQRQGRTPIGDPGFSRDEDGRPGGKYNRQPRHRRREQPQMWVR